MKYFLKIIILLLKVTVIMKIYIKKLLMMNMNIAKSKIYFGLLDGLNDLWNHRAVTFQEALWSNEMLWQAMYFSIAVWISIYTINAPRYKPME